jgi:hypothetical protein
MNPEFEELFDQPVESNFDSFGAECDQFREDVQGLILGTLNAALERLHESAESELKDLNAKIKEIGGRQYLIDQERFLRNMALVALASRLTHALRKMAKPAHFRAGKKQYNAGDNSEFQRLWKEYSERFGFDFQANAARIAFTETMRKVRNQIVHDGGEGNPFKEVTFESYNQGEDAYLDKSFSQAYPEFVTGNGMFAEVEVSEKQLQEMIDSSYTLLEWLAVELRKQEQVYIEELNKQLKERKK